MTKNRYRLVASFAVALLAAVGQTSVSSATPIVDGTINIGEYTQSVVVDSTPDLGGVYDPGTSGSFAGGTVNCHGDWTLHWDWDATNLYLAADPMGAPSSCADTVFGVMFNPSLGDPNDAPTGCEACTGTFYSNGMTDGHFAAECVGGLFDIAGGEANFLTLPPSSTWTFAQNVVGATINPIEWSIPRADLDKYGDITYTDSPDFECTWLRASAFDSRGITNSTGPGARTIWLALNSAATPCTLPVGPPTCGAVCGDGTVELFEECDDGDTIPGDGCDGSCNLELPAACETQDNVLSSVDSGVAPVVTSVWSDENGLPSSAPGAFDMDDGTFWNSDWMGPGNAPAEGYGNDSYLYAELASAEDINQIRIVQDTTTSEAIDLYVSTDPAALEDSLTGWTQVAGLTGQAAGTELVNITTVSASKVKMVFPTSGNVADARIMEFQARFCCATDADCSDGIGCNGLEICDPTGNCGPGPLPCQGDCDTGVCNEPGLCVAVPASTVCDSGLDTCTVPDSCTGVASYPQGDCPNNGGGGDTDEDQVCDLDDDNTSPGFFTLLRVKLKTAGASSGDDGKAMVVGLLSDTDSEGSFITNLLAGTNTMDLTDSDSFSVPLLLENCSAPFATQRKVRCRSNDGRVRVRATKKRSTSEYLFLLRIKAKKLTIAETGPGGAMNPVAPLTGSLVHGFITRVDTIDGCTLLSGGQDRKRLVCSE
jgi:cysteine-rich repeat protein